MLSHLYVLEERGGDQLCQRGVSKAKEVRKQGRGVEEKTVRLRAGAAVHMGHGQDTGIYSIYDEEPLENRKQENVSFTF